MLHRSDECLKVNCTKDKKNKVPSIGADRTATAVTKRKRNTKKLQQF